MVKIDIFSGFLGAGKTTLIKKLIQEVYKGEQVVLIENEFGEIGVDGGFLQDAGIRITEMNSGCICCTLVGDFAKALREVAEQYSPDRIVIEPSGVGKLSDVIRAVQGAGGVGAQLNAFCTVVDANKCKMYLKNFGEFFLDQVENAGCIVLSHTGNAQKVAEAVALLKEHTSATIVTTDWKELPGKELLSAIERKDTLEAELKKLAEEAHEHGQHHHEEDEHGCCHHHHDEDACHHHEHEHEGCHHHDHEGECHHHEHEHGECHHGHEHCEGHHHADEVFTSWGVETSKAFTREGLQQKLAALASGEYGEVLRAKGIVAGDGPWLYFDYVPGEPDVREGTPSVTGRLCVIGCKLDEDKLKALFLE